MTSYGIDELVPVIKRASKAVAIQWPGVVDDDDVEQSITMHLLERPASIEKIGAMDPKARYRAIVGVGHQIASQERADYDHFKGSYKYSVKELKELLRKGVLVDPPTRFQADVRDLQKALGLLEVKTPQYAKAILLRYADNEIPEAGADRERLSAALGALAGLMNRTHRTQFSARDDGPGTRQILSRVEALDRAGSDWDGEGE